MRVAHESPLCIFDYVQQVTDYDYALVHLFEQSDQYFQKFQDSIAKGREVILDNSIFELGEAFDHDRYYHWIMRLQPQWYIIPDVLEDCQGTINSMDNWFSKYNVPSHIKSIGVVQGKQYKEIKECYKSINNRVDKVAISFDYSYFIKPDSKNKYKDYMSGRQSLIDQLYFDHVINFKKPHHLLGCSLPQEFKHYQRNQYSFIDTVDTSNPVVAGLNGVVYNIDGLETKNPTKLVDYMFIDVVTGSNLMKIGYNIGRFKEFCKCTG